MKVLCPRCEQTVNLRYLEKKGDQMAHCVKCNVTVSATFKKDKDRLYWEVYFERPVSKKEPPRGGCGPAIWIAIALLLTLIAVARCDRQAPDKPPAEASEKQFQN
jgi:hypothetical protein